MTTDPLYPTGRASAPQAGIGAGSQTARPRYDLIARLRDVRIQGESAMTAAEQYDPDFSLKLSACSDKADASRLLDEWLSHRVGVLTRIQAELLHVWEEAQV